MKNKGNSALYKYIKKRRLKKELLEVIDYICSHPNTMLSSISASDNFFLSRLIFSLLGSRNNRIIISAIDDIIKAINFEEYTKTVHEIGNLIERTLNTARYPLHLIGFGFDRNSIRQLKVYYMLSIFDEYSLNKEVIMGKIDKDLSLIAIKKLLKEIGCDEQTSKAEDIFRLMSSESHELEFIGINIEKDKSPNLKLYFNLAGTPHL